MCATSQGVLCLGLLLCLGQALAQTSFTYQMETVCNSVDQLLQYNQRASIKIGGLTSPINTGQLCVIILTTDPKFHMQVDVNILRCTDPSVVVKIQYSGGLRNYACSMNPSSGSLKVEGNRVTIGLDKNIQAYQYSLEVVVKPVEVPFDPNGKTTSSTVSAGLVAGIVCAIFGAIIILAIIGVCCHRHAKKVKRSMYYNSETKVPLDDMEILPNGYNSAARNDYESSPRSKMKLLSENDGSQSSGRTNSDRPQTLSIRNTGRPPPQIGKMDASPTKSRGFDYEREDDKDPYDVMDGDPEEPRPPKSPFMAALHSNSRFRKSFEENERDAETRRKRISSSSMEQSQDSNTSGEITPPPLPSVPVSRSPGTKKKNHASIRRAPRPVSSSSEDPIGKSGEETDDPNIRVIRDSNDSPSSTEVIPIKVQNPTKSDTRHTLRPNRGKKSSEPPQETRSKNRLRDIDAESQSSRRNETPPRAGQFQKYEDGIRSSKRSNKSPKAAAKGLGHRRRGEENSRPTTPTSMAYDDDLESLPPLERTTSRQSLYASRSSLYNRRRRKNSFGESIASYAPSYAHDDIDFYKRRSYENSRDYRDYEDDDSDGYVQPISRQEKARMFRSLGDLEHDRREKSTTATQTLRETATQTGKDQNVVMSKKRVVQRKRRSKSLSAAGTQTTKKEKSRKDGRGSESDGETMKKEKRREKAELAKDVADGEKPKPKPKPKPRPRKSQSTSANTTKDNVEPEKAEEKAGEKKRRKKKKKATGTESAAVNGAAQDVGGLEQGQYPPGGVPPYVMAAGQPYLPYGAPPQGFQPLPGGQMGQPAFGMHPQAFGIRPPAYPQHVPHPQGSLSQMPHPQGSVSQMSQAASVPGQPKKSNWDLLCEMTDPNKQPDDVTSMASSVFTNHLPANYGGYPSMPYGYGQPSPGGQMVTMAPPTSAPVQPSPPGIQGEVKKMSAAPHESRVLVTDSEGESGSSYETDTESEEEDRPTGGYKSDHSIGKSSWDALKELSERQQKSAAGAKHEDSAETPSKMFTVV